MVPPPPAGSAGHFTSFYHVLLANTCQEACPDSRSREIDPGVTLQRAWIQRGDSLWPFTEPTTSDSVVISDSRGITSFNKEKKTLIFLSQPPRVIMLESLFGSEAQVAVL